MFPFDLVHEVKVGLVEGMHPDVTVLATTRVGYALWMHGNRVERTKVASNSADLVLEDLVIESSFKFALASGRGCHVGGSLATSEDDKVLLWGDGGGVERRIGNIGLQDAEVASG